VKNSILTIILLLSILTLFGCSGSESSQENQSNTSQAATIGTSPLFSAQDLNGTWRSADQWLGKQPVVINFWGTWCPPCRREIPDLVKLNNEYSPKGVVLVSLAVNDSPSSVKEYAADNNMNWELLMAEDQILVDYGVTTGIPTTIFIDRNGNEVTRFIGMRDYGTLKQGFDAIL
jgi:thiol-disulfide isomerase/thioredoxin